MRTRLVLAATMAMVVAVGILLLGPAPASGQDSAAKKVYVPNCSKQEDALAKANEVLKGLRLDLSPCKGLTGSAKSKCERPLREAHSQATRAARAAVTEAKKALTCCNRPSASGCGGGYIR